MQHDEIDNIQNGQRLPTLIMCMACFETATINPLGSAGGSGDILVNVCNDSGLCCIRGLNVSSSGHSLTPTEADNKTADPPAKLCRRQSCSVGMAQGMCGL